ncbi:MAG: HAMP domain-containing protein [Bacteroidetes bacterium]|jgi:signal transduction histidine kinase|nr:HAMP domain-containing protein [Bacteroidota bacterium]
MNIKKRISSIVFLSILTIAGLYGYILKITFDIDAELRQVESIERFEEGVTQLGVITESYLSTGDERYYTSWLQISETVENLLSDVGQFQQYQVVKESIPSIRSAFELTHKINTEPGLYPDPDMRAELKERAITRLRTDVKQLMTLSNDVSKSHIQNIKTLQVDQRLHYLFILIPAILAIILMAYFMRRRIVRSLQKLQQGTAAFAAGRFGDRIELKGNDEFGELALQFNSMAEKLKNQVEKEEILIQKLEKQTEELKSSNEELENFASTASHDLKEPLRMIRNFMGLLEKKYADQLDEKANKYIHFAVDGAARMATLIDDLLEFSRIGRKHKEVKKADLNQILEGVMHYYDSKIEKIGARVEYDSMPVIDAVPVSMRMLFQNLVDNALKYHNRVPPEIDVNVEEKDVAWQFSVSDNGIGIDEQYKQDIFLLFKRLHSSDQYTGTGMGLAICKKIVEQHDGEIWVESEPGAGSTFYFTISKHIGSSS